MHRRAAESDTVRPRTEPQVNRQRGQMQKNEKQQRVESTPKQRYEAERLMMEQFQTMMDTYQAQQKSLKNRKAWVNSDRTWHGPFKDEPPSEMTVTHVNQTKDLYNGSGLETAFSQFQTSKEWLVAHSLKTLKLTLKDLVNRGQLQRSTVNKDTGKVQQRLQFEAVDIASFELRINAAIQTYSKRIKWLLQGSRQMFGTVHGRNVALLVDSSDACLSFGRRTSYVQALTHLLDEQLSLKKGLYVGSFGTDSQPLWVSDSARIVNDTIIEEARQWLDRLVNSGGCNLLEAIKHAYTINGLHTACIVVGSLPDQNMNVLYHYVEQLALQKPLRLYIVSYECPHHQANATFKKLAELTDGSYHCYTSTEVDQIYTSTDIAILLDEVRAAQDLINKITQMKLGYLGTALVTISNQITKQVSLLPSSRFYPRPVGHDMPLTLEMPSFSPSTSTDWLSKHGLKAKGLDLYQVLAPNAYSYLEEFIPVIRKTVQSQVHSRAMAQFQWHDGTMKNVHVDMSLLFEYQKQLGSIVKLYEKRIDWLSCASRRLFGSVTENNLIIVLDTSLFNSNHIVHIQNTLRHVLQEQMCNKNYLNIIAFGEEIILWKPSMVKITGDVLQEAWKWVLQLHCSGGRNILGALRRAFECDDLASTVDVEGVYLLTSGVPDQPADIVQSYIEETAAGRPVRLHVILFNVDDRDLLGVGGVVAPGVSAPGEGSVLPCRYASITQTAEILRQLAHSSHDGRFHWYRETGIIESDDLSLVSLEIEKAINFSKKCQMLVESVKKKDSLDMKFLEMMPDCETQNSNQQSTTKPLPPPRETALSQARKGMATDKDKESAVPKALAYKEGQLFKADPMAKVKKSKGPKVEQAFFYTGNKNDVGAVFRQYQTKPISSGGKAIPAITITEKEDQVTTKDWLRKYSLSKLHLNLNKIALGPGRSHQMNHVSDHVSTINKTVEAKSCSVFPTVNVNGTLRHLLLTPVQLLELQQQIRHVLTRYLQRLQWLLAGSRRVFGTVVEKSCVFLIDTSGSMEERMEELKKELIALVWEQLHKHHIKFNLIAFSRACTTWQSNLVDATEEKCHEAAQWVSQLTADGNTCTLEALQIAFSQCRNLSEASSGSIAVYLLTDGKPDTSMSMVLNDVRQRNAEKQIVVNTISFNCQDSLANEFLKSLASENRGRYHCVAHRHVSDGGFDVHRFAHQLMEDDFESPERPVMPELSGDDVVRLAQEVQKGRRFIAQSRTYLELYDDLKQAQQPAHDCFTVGPSSKLRPTTAKH